MNLMDLGFETKTGNAVPRETNSQKIVPLELEIFPQMFDPMLGRLPATQEETSWINGEAFLTGWEKVKSISLK